MYVFNIHANIMTTISNTPVTIEFFYQDTFCFEYLVMPWETGTPIAVTFPLKRMQNQCNTDNLHVKTYDNHMILESVIVNDIVQNISYHNEQNKNAKKNSPLSLADILNISPDTYSVIKISDISDAITVSFSHQCNHNIYVAGTDCHKSFVNIPQNIDNFNCIIELFKTNVMTAEKQFNCAYNNGQFHISEENLPFKHGYADARALHKTLENIYPAPHLYDADIIEYPPTNTLHISYISDKPKLLCPMINRLQYEIQAKKYSVIKIEGIPEKILRTQTFYNNGAYFIAASNYGLVDFSAVRELDSDTPITVSFYGHDTAVPQKICVLKQGDIFGCPALQQKHLTKKKSMRKKSA